MKKLFLFLALSMTACNQAQMHNFARGLQGTQDSGALGNFSRGFGNAYTGTVAPVASVTPRPVTQIQTPEVSYRQIGNTTYGSDGTSYNQIGNTVYGSDGTTCRKIGGTVYCD